MSLRLNGSTSGYTELDAGAVAGNNTIKMPTANGSAYQVLRNGATAGTTEFGGAIVSGTAVASTSGTSIDFTGIPSWVKRVTVMFDGVSTNGSSPILIQLGDSGGIETTGYNSVSGYGTGAGQFTSSTAGLILEATGGLTAAALRYGSMIVSALNSNTWVEQVGIYSTGTTSFGAGGGAKTLSGTLDRVRITTVNGTDQFDAGTVNLLWE